MRKRHVPSPARARQALALAGTFCVVAGLVQFPAASRSAASVSGPTVSAASSRSGTTVKGPRLYDPATGKQLPDPSTVTVSVTTHLVNQVVQVSWTHFTPSVFDPSSPYYQATNGGATDYSVMVAECRGTNPTSWDDCSEAAKHGISQARDQNGIVNTTYAITTAKGTGQVPFDVQTGLQNKPLGCDQAHQCSLVIVPGQGGTPKNCQDHSQDVDTLGTGNAAPVNTFWPATGACSWNDRIIVPLHFAPVPSGCPQRNPAFSAAGSPMLASAMQQWQTGLCAGKNGLTVAYNSQSGEPLAVSETTTGAASIALTTRPASAQQVPTGNTHYVYAPVAVSAVSIAYWLDNAFNGQPLSGLRLNQRLLAKLLTTSYNPSFSGDKGITGNPFDMFGDPEFAALNKPIVHASPFSNQSWAIPTVMQGGSDMTWTLTRWIAADPTASAFLKGTKAPGGMHVNTFYRGVKYPTNTFTAQDPSLEYSHLYNPVFGLNNVVNFQAVNAYPGDSWVKDNTGNFPAEPPEPVGDRELVAVMDQADAALNGFPVAAIPNAAGRFVKPSNASMAAALSHMTGDGNGTKQMNLASKDPKAYPLTMVVYAMVPTSGLCHTAAAGVARFLDFVAGPGQAPGLRPGKLPPGYLPLTASLRAKTKVAARRVKNESCTAKKGEGGGNGNANGNSGGGQSGTPTPTPGASLTPSPSASPALSLPGPTAPAIRLLAAHPPAPLSRFLLPVLLILGGAAALAGSFVFAGSAPGGVGGQVRRLGRGAAAWSKAPIQRLTRRRKP
jgi:hypothetical protein